MDLLKALQGAVGSNELGALASQFGLDSSSVSQVMDQVVPTLGKGIQGNASSPGGLESLLGALQNGGHEKYVKDISAVVSNAGVTDGNNILGHILGSKDTSRNVAAQASQATGVGSDVIKQMLPMIATMVMGTLSKESAGGSKLAENSGSGGLGDMLSSMLDSDGDGSAVDDVLDIAKKFF